MKRNCNVNIMKNEDGQRHERALSGSWNTGLENVAKGLKYAGDGW